MVFTIKTSILHYKLPALLVSCLCIVAMCLKGCGFITHNQIEFQKLLEQKRNNMRIEELTELRDQATRQYQTEQVALGNRNATENERSNRERERFNLLSLDEQRRHNVQTEGLSASQLSETVRSNKAREAETNRANVAKETEQHRSNTVQEWLKRQQNVETNRANLAQERLKHEQNVEQNRSNLANEVIRSEANYISLNSLFESQRANRAREAYQLADLEQQRDLKERELADRYFWQDKLNATLDSIFGTENFGGIVYGKGQEALQKGQALYDVGKAIVQPGKQIVKRAAGFERIIEEWIRNPRI